MGEGAAANQTARSAVVRSRRTLGLLALTAAVVTLAFASVAYACVSIAGSITTTYNGTTCQNRPASCKVHPGNAMLSTGSGLTVRSDGGPGSGAPDGTLWSLYFLNYKSLGGGARTCMADWGNPEQKIAGPVRQSNSSVGPVSAQIPLTALQSNSAGPALVCWIDSDSSGNPNYNFATPPTELEILGGPEPPTNASPTSLHRGDEIVANAAGAVPGLVYELRFVDSAARAAGTDGIVIGPHDYDASATASGAIPSTTGVIPATAAQGGGVVYFSAQGVAATRTQSAEVTLSGVAGTGGGGCKPNDPGPDGGLYKELTPNGCERHHMPSQGSFKDNPAYSRDCTPAIRMDPTDHQKTGSHTRNGADAKAYRAKQKAMVDAGKFVDAFEMDVNDIRTLFGNKYDAAIQQARDALARMPQCI